MRSAFFFALVLITSCAYRTEKEGEPVVRLNAAAMGFSEVQAAILGPKCARCHGWVASYDSVVANLAEISARTQSADPGFMMPPPGRGTLTAEEKAALQSWISRGAPQLGGGDGADRPVSPDPGPSPDPAPAPPGLNFAQVKEKVFTPKCARCHGSMLDSYASVEPLLGEIESRVRSTFDFEQMPPARAAQLTEEEKNLLLDWIKAGAPEASEGDQAPAPNPAPPREGCEDNEESHEESDFTTNKRCERK